jgi:hypothetical protein
MWKSRLSLRRNKNINPNPKKEKGKSEGGLCFLTFAFYPQLKIAGGDDRIRTCEGLLTLNGLANRRLQPLGHISAPPY